MISEYIDQEIRRFEDYALRRVKGIPNNRRLWVLTCMDERVPIEEALRIQPGDAHIFRNAGAIVTDDAVRSLALTANFFGTKEAIIVTHTDCGMLRFTGEEVVRFFAEKGVKISEVQLDPYLSTLRVGEEEAVKWFKFFTDLGAQSPDDVALMNVEALRRSPLIPKDLKISAYVYEVETGRLRKPHQKIHERTSRFEHGTVVKD